MHMAQEMSLEVVKGISRVKHEGTIALQILKEEKTRDGEAFYLDKWHMSVGGGALQIIWFISQKQN